MQTSGRLAMSRWSEDIGTTKRQLTTHTHTFVCSRSFAIASNMFRRAACFQLGTHTHTQTLLERLKRLMGLSRHLALSRPVAVLWCALGLMQTLIKLIIVCGYTLSTIDINKQRTLYAAQCTGKCCTGSGGGSLGQKEAQSLMPLTWWKRCTSINWFLHRANPSDERAIKHRWQICIKLWRTHTHSSRILCIWRANNIIDSVRITNKFSEITIM